MKKLTKEQIKGPDSFIKTVAEGYKVFDHYARWIAIAVGAVMAIGLGAIGWQKYRSSVEMEAQQAFYMADKAYTEAKKSFTPPPAADAKDKDAEAKADTNKSKTASGDPDQDYAAAIAGFRDVITKFPKTHASFLAALSMADIYVEHKGWDKALTALQSVRTGQGTKGLLEGAVTMMLGNVQANKGDCNAAIAAWDNVIKAKTLAYLKDEALLRQGQCYHKLGNREKAQEIYKQVNVAAGQKSTGQAARRYLRLLDLDGKE